MSEVCKLCRCIDMPLIDSARNEQLKWFEFYTVRFIERFIDTTSLTDRKWL